jgi:hypothetical protein
MVSTPCHRAHWGMWRVCGMVWSTAAVVRSSGSVKSIRQHPQSHQHAGSGLICRCMPVGAQTPACGDSLLHGTLRRILCRALSWWEQGLCVLCGMWRGAAVVCSIRAANCQQQPHAHRHHTSSPDCILASVGGKTPACGDSLLHGTLRRILCRALSWWEQGVCAVRHVVCTPARRCWQPPCWMRRCGPAWGLPAAHM